jgi:hypothetical protein
MKGLAFHAFFFAINGEVLILKIENPHSFALLKINPRKRLEGYHALFNIVIMLCRGIGWLSKS